MRVIKLDFNSRNTKGWVPALRADVQDADPTILVGETFHAVDDEGHAALGQIAEAGEQLVYVDVWWDTFRFAGTGRAVVSYRSPYSVHDELSLSSAQPVRFEHATVRPTVIVSPGAVPANA